MVGRIRCGDDWRSMLDFRWARDERTRRFWRGLRYQTRCTYPYHRNCKRDLVEYLDGEVRYRLHGWTLLVWDGILLQVRTTPYFATITTQSRFTTMLLPWKPFRGYSASKKYWRGELSVACYSPENPSVPYDVRTYLFGGDVKFTFNAYGELIFHEGVVHVI